MSGYETVRSYAPGRTELAGNHTDHQGGRVIAAAVSCGIALEARLNGSTIAHVESDGFAPFDIDVASTEPRERERNTTAALVRGVVAGVRALGVEVCGFDLKATSTVPSGGGLSSSAAFELALAWALLDLSGATGGFDDVAGQERLAVQLAKVGQAAERDWFGKACGLMDQLAVALGGVVAIDFAADEPHIERIGFDFSKCGHVLCLIDTHCDHSRYTDEYSRVPRDMAAVAALLGANTLSQVPESMLYEHLDEVRASLGDVPALRALHYYYEMHLVDARVQALRAGDFAEFLYLTRLSGASSAQYLQNVSTFDRASQPAMMALALVDTLLAGEGACRIHGGGFGGTVQAFVPLDRVDDLKARIDRALGEGSCCVYEVGRMGARMMR